jgi:glucokinase
MHSKSVSGFHAKAAGPYAIGIDVGGTKIAAGIVALESGTVLERHAIPTRPERGGGAVLDDVLGLAETLWKLARAQAIPVRGVGLGVAELVDLEGNVASSHTIAWRGLPVRERLALIAPTVVEADVRAHALAEARYGTGRSYQLFVLVTVGTGISSCLVQDGVPYAGARGNALVLASSPLTTQCTACGEIVRPVLEEFAAGPALVARYNRMGATRLARAEDVLAASVLGDSAARQIVASAAEALGVSVGWLVNVLDPEAVIIGGGIARAGNALFEPLEAALRGIEWQPGGRQVRLLAAQLGEFAGAIGSARNAFNHCH